MSRPLWISMFLFTTAAVACGPTSQSSRGGGGGGTGGVVCGDGNLGAGETCDGTALGSATCETLGFGPGALACASNCLDYDRSGCGPTASCGNGRIDGSERCDGALLGGQSCAALGLGAGTLGCDSNCAEFDTSSCGTPPTCGNGIKDGVEQCDGSDFGGLTCGSLGLGAGALVCAGDCLSYDASGCCAPDCTGRVCGIDGCGGSCGSCTGGEVCDAAGQCVGSCTPDCSGRMCGPDPICGSNCGTCSGTDSCNAAGQCVGTCTPDCSGRMCGPDPFCGINCGTCSGTDSCNAAGQCVGGCTPDCTGRMCGPDPFCGINCGTCAGTDTCDATGQCVATCTSDCSGRVCGPDPICGTSCGACTGAATCTGAGLCVTGCAAGTSRCTDGFAFEACGWSDATGNNTYGPRIPCTLGDSCVGGDCARATCLPTEVVFLLDRSSSMLSGSTWTWTVDTFLQAVYERETANLFGLRQFPSGTACSVGTVLPMAMDNYSSIAGSITDPAVGSATPIEGALQGFTGLYGDPNDSQAVVLMTDGDETCGTQQGAIDAASALWRVGIRVYVIAITTMANQAFLNNVAAAGGTGASWLATDGFELESALGNIFLDLYACECGTSAFRCEPGEVAYACAPDNTWNQTLCAANELCVVGNCVCQQACAGAGDCGLPDGCGGFCPCEGGLRIVGGGDSGRLEVFHNGEWGTVCDDSFGVSDAIVACGQLGYADGTVVASGSVPDGSGSIWMDDLACTGAELRLEDCSFAGWGVDNCDHREDVGVSCTGVCVPDCTGAVCGADGCGGSCGSCPVGESCDPAGQCQLGCTIDTVAFSGSYAACAIDFFNTMTCSSCDAILDSRICEDAINDAAQCQVGVDCTGCTDDTRADGVTCAEIEAYSYLGTTQAQVLLDYFVASGSCGGGGGSTIDVSRSPGTSISDPASNTAYPTGCGDFINGVVSTVVVSDTHPITDLNVTVNITHTYAADLAIYLMFDNRGAPICVELSSGNGPGSNYSGTIFDDEAGVLITGGTVPFSGSYQPEGTLSAFDGVPMNGTWTLYVSDHLSADSGTLDSWSLSIGY